MEAIERTEILSPDLIGQYLTSISYRSPRTISTYRNILHTIQKSLVTSLELATIEELLILLEDFGQSYKQTSLNVTRAILRSYLKFCGREDDAKRIKYANIKWMPHIDLTQEQLDQVLVQARDNERALLLTLYSTGARLGELCGMAFEKDRPQVSDVDWIAGRIKIIGKGRRADYVIFFPRREEAIEALHNYIGPRNSGPILPNRYRSWYLVRRAAARVGIKLHPHTLRHAGAHSLMMQGVNSRIIQTWLRHASIEMTERYSSVMKGDLLKVAGEKEWR